MLDITREAPSQEGPVTGQLIIDEGEETRIRVEVQTSWDEPTYEEYVAVAQRHFEPLLRIYNAAYGSKLRLSIQPKQEAEPKLPPKAKELFDQFAVLANKGILHPLGWKRF